MSGKRLRFLILFFVFLLMFTGIAVRLVDLQWQQGSQYLEASLSAKTREIRIPGTRGMILDNDGIILAYDQKSYDVNFVRDPSRTSDEYRIEDTEIIRKTISIIEKNGVEPILSFRIIQNKLGGFEFYFGANDVTDNRIERWTKNMLIKTDKYNTPEEIYYYLRGRYMIPDDMSVNEAHKILSVWQEIQMTFYRSYIPVSIAKDVNMATVAEIEMRALELYGVSIKESTTRVYPKQDLASHILGYMGKMQKEETIIDMEANGYDRDDLIGTYGIENTMESELSGNIGARTGSMTVEVNNLGKVTREITYQAPLSGNDVVLTIKSGLQKKLEVALGENIRRTNELQMSLYLEDKEYYDEELRGRDLSMAIQGAALVINVNTGAVLAMTSYPSFDPNIFTNGLSHDEYAVIKDDKAVPLFNKAISSRATPGSIFKMVTGIAGLMENKITLETLISDEGMYKEHMTNKSLDGPTCWIYPYVAGHADQTIVEALKNSCNYFFYTVGDKLRIDLLYGWAERLGLTTKTNIELTGEVTSQVGSQENLYSPEKRLDGTALLVYRQIIELTRDVCEDLEYDYEDSLYEEVAIELMNLYTIKEYGSDARNILRTRLNIPQSTIRAYNPVTETTLYNAISHRINQLSWNRNHTILTAVGQSVTLLTPVGVARYLAALVNGGNVYQIRLVDSIVQPDGTIIEEKRPALVESIDIPQEYIDALKLGMKDVTLLAEGGTAGSYFEGFKYLEDVGGKTGTAQVTTIDIENNAWFIAFAPFDEPEIAVVVFIPNGYSGNQATYTAKEIIEYYLDKKNGIISPVTIPLPNELVA